MDSHKVVVEGNVPGKRTEDETCYPEKQTVPKVREMW